MLLCTAWPSHFLHEGLQNAWEWAGDEDVGYACTQRALVSSQLLCYAFTSLTSHVNIDHFQIHRRDTQDLLNGRYKLEHATTRCC